MNLQQWLHINLWDGLNRNCRDELSSFISGSVSKKVSGRRIAVDDAKASKWNVNAFPEGTIGDVTHVHPSWTGIEYIIKWQLSVSSNMQNIRAIQVNPGHFSIVNTGRDIAPAATFQKQKLVFLNRNFKKIRGRSKVHRSEHLFFSSRFQCRFQSIIIKYFITPCHDTTMTMSRFSRWIISAHLEMPCV